MEEYELLSMENRHIEQVVGIEKAAFLNPWKERSFREELTREDSYNIIARSLKGKIAGYLCFRIQLNEMSIFKIAVHPEMRKNGIASMMLIAGFKTAVNNNAAESFLETRASNIKALALYRKFGFAIVGTRPNYYAKECEDAFILKKTLKEE